MGVLGARTETNRIIKTVDLPVRNTNGPYNSVKSERGSVITRQEQEIKEDRWQTTDRSLR